MGGYERQSRPFALGPDGLDAVPADFNGRLLPEEWERLEEITANSAVRVPAMADVELRQVVNGPEGFTPDNEFCLGPTEMSVASGWLPASALTGSRGPGAWARRWPDWILDGDPEQDLWEMDVRRFGAQYRSPTYTLARVVENYETYYDIKYPGQERLRGGRCGPRRPTRGTWPTTPSSVRRAAGSGSATTPSNASARGPEKQPARLGRASCGPPPSRPSTERPARRSGCSTSRRSPRSRCPARARRPSSSGCATTGSRAATVGSPTPSCSTPRGGVEADLTVSQLGAELFQLVTGTAFGGHDLAWLRTARPPPTGRWCCGT